MLNLPKIGIWGTLSNVSCRALFAMVTAFCGIGIYWVKYQVIDRCVFRGFAMFGMLPRWLNSLPAPLLLCRVPGKTHRCGRVSEERMFASFLTRQVSARSFGLFVVIAGRTLLNILRGRARHA